METLDTYSKNLLGIALCFVCVATLVNFPLLGDSNQIYFLSRALRETIFLVMALYVGLVFVTPSDRSRLTAGTVRMAGLITLWALTCVLYSIMFKGVPTGVALLGLKFFQSAPFFFAGYFLVTRSSKTPLFKFAALLRWYVALLALDNVIRIVIRFASDKPIIIRYSGLFPNATAYGATLVACSLWFLCAHLMRNDNRERTRYGLWLVICIVLSFATGSRMAMTLTMATFLLSFNNRLDSRTKKILLGTAPLLVVAFFFIVSRPTLSRHQAKVSNENRLTIAEDAISNFKTPADVIFGYGVGLSSSSTAKLLGSETAENQVGNAHSGYLEITASFGLVGLALLLAVFLTSLNRGVSPAIDFFVLIVAAFFVGLNVWRLFPTGALLGLLWGQLFGIGVMQRARTRDGSPGSPKPAT